MSQPISYQRAKRGIPKAARPRALCFHPAARALVRNRKAAISADAAGQGFQASPRTWTRQERSGCADRALPRLAKGELQRLDRKGGLIYWKVVLREGKNHEVKRIFKVLGSSVVHLHRQSVAGLEIDKISPGKYQILKENEAKKLIEGIPK